MTDITQKMVGTKHRDQDNWKTKLTSNKERRTTNIGNKNIAIVHNKCFNCFQSTNTTKN